MKPKTACEATARAPFHIGPVTKHCNNSPWDRHSPVFCAALVALSHHCSSVQVQNSSQAKAAQARISVLISQSENQGSTQQELV